MINNKIKILQINVDADIGSNGGIARDIGSLVAQHGWESYIAYGRNVLPNQHSTLIKIGNKFDIYLHALQARVFDNSGLGSFYTTKKFLKIIDEINPNIVHLHNIHGYYVNYRLLVSYLKHKNIPIVWTLHDCWPFTGHCAYFDMVDCEKWKTNCYNCQLMKYYPKSLFFDRSNDNYVIKRELFTSLSNLTIVTVSKWLGSLVSESFLSKYPLEIIYNGVDTDIFKYKENDIKNKLGIVGKKVLLAVAANWTTEKGLLDYYKLSDLISNDYKIVLLGLNDQQLKECPLSIIGIKKTSNISELVDYYSMSDIVLNLSYQETFGMTTIEGMACGAPVITGNKTASPELLSEDTGCIVEPGNIPQVLSAIEYIEKKGGRVEYASKCRTRVLRFFDKNENYMLYYNLYNKLLNI